MESVKLAEQRSQHIASAMQIVSKAEAEDRTELNEPEQAEFDQLMGEAETLKSKIAFHARKEAVHAADADLRRVQPREVAPASIPVQPRIDAKTSRTALRAWLAAGSNVRITSEMQEAAARCGINLGSRWLEINAADGEMGVGDTAQGAEFTFGQFSNELVKKLKALSGMMQVARIMPTPSGERMTWAVSDDTANIGEIVAEHGTVDEEEIATSSLTIDTFKYSSRAVRVSVEWLQDSRFPVESFITDNLSERIARKLNLDFTTGTGSGQPYGCATEATLGVSVNTSFAWTDLNNLVLSVDRAYTNENTRFMMNRATWGSLTNLVDGESRPLYIPSLTSPAPMQLLGYPIVINDDLDDVNETGTGDRFPVLFGDFSKYIILAPRSIVLIRQDELFSRDLEVGFLAWARYGGRLVNPAAVKKLKVVDASA